MRKQIEILAPAGSLEAMKAAMNAGCDAVYIGGTSFGARAYANNPGEEELLRAIDEAHIRDKRLYLTVNTLLKEKELTEQLYQFLKRFYLQGLDAVIVQDTGVMHFIHRHFPKLPIHASTQMTLTMAQGADVLREVGVTRLVTARELSLKEVKEISTHTDLEIETFVHGALCYCYSGQCLMSSMIGGRSGNRGRCAQPCRMPYELYDGKGMLSDHQEKYLLSPRDMNTLALIPKLVDAGIHSFKIEGRMKRPEYAAAVSAAYRKYTDYYLEHGKESFERIISQKEFQQDQMELMDIYNRGGFSQGYGNHYHGKHMMSMTQPNHSGVSVGTILSQKGGRVQIALKEEIHAQDILEIRQKDRAVYEFTVKDGVAAGEIFSANIGVAKVKAGDQVFRTRNNQLLERIAEEYIRKDRKLPVSGTVTARLGQKLTFTLTYQKQSVTAYHDIVQAAVKQPVSEERMRDSLQKTGDTLFYLKDLVVDADEAIFLPVAWLNEIRREAMQRLTDAILSGYHRKEEDIPERRIRSIEDPGNPQGYGICVSVQTREQFDAALSFPEITAIYADYDQLYSIDLLELSKASKKEGKRFYPVLPHICRLDQYERLRMELPRFIGQEGICGFVVKNFEEITLLLSLELKEHGQEIILNHNMYVFNREAKQFWREKGIRHYGAPMEQNSKELKALGISDCDLLVYGYLPFMVSTQCVYENTVRCCVKQSEAKAGYLVDRMGKRFPVGTNCVSCYNVIYNGQCLSLLKKDKEVKDLHPGNIRLDFTMETGEEMKQIMTSFLNAYLQGKDPQWDGEHYTTGHFSRGVE